MLSTLKRKLARFLALPLREKFWCLLALPLLAVARLMVLLLPASRYSRLFGHDMGILPLSLLVAAEQHLRARHIGNAIAAIANITPWRSLCLEQALAVQFLLRWYRIPSVVYFGVARDEAAEIRAHAWTCVGPVFVTGGRSFAQFTVVRSYLSLLGYESLLPRITAPAVVATAQTVSAVPTRAS